MLIVIENIIIPHDMNIGTDEWLSRWEERHLHFENIILKVIFIFNIHETNVVVKYG